jgi:hypothetical protein
MQQTSVESVVLVTDEPPSTERGEPPSSADEPPLPRIPDRTTKTCTLDCTHCSIAMLFGVLARAKALEERAVPQEEANRLKHQANRIVQEGRKQFLETVTSSGGVPASLKARMAVVSGVRNRLDECHDPNAENFFKQAARLLDEAAPKKISGCSYGDQS